MFLLNPKDKTPIFMQLKKQILDFIALGILKENDQLPSVRSLATDLGINPNTVAKAYQELEIEGYLYTMAGKGVFVNKVQFDEKVIENKLHEFAYAVQECQKYGLTYEQLYQVLNETYGKEVKPC